MDTKKEKTWFQICAVVIAGLSALSNGIFYTWPSPFMLKISRDKENYDISEKEASKFTLITFVTVLIFCPIFSKLCDIYGRKRILILTAFVDVAVWVVKATAKSVYVFYFARVLAGVSDGIMFASLPPYLAEVATPSIRGTWGNSQTFFFCLGELLATAVGSYFNVQESSYIFLPIPIIFFILFSFMPESPYYYIMKGKNIEAKESLQKLKRKKDVSSEFIALKVDVERMMSEEGTWTDLFRIRSNRRGLSIAIFLKTSQVLGGASVFIVYSQYIFDQSEGSFSKETSSIIYIGLTFLLYICACVLVDRLGRKKAVIGSLLPCGIVLSIESVYFYIYQKRTDVDLSSFRWVPIAGMVLHKIFYTYGIGIVPTIILSEVFSISIRAKAISVWICSLAIVTFAMNYLFYALSSSIGLFAPFIFFACCNFTSAFLTYFILPETSGRTLEEIQQLLKGNKPVLMPEDIIESEKLVVNKVDEMYK
ncbi:hypothetical protein JTB14_025667 [Gonioctena quinquepunctata]|nr:hypothetical protein JTB14_025667 [Gonioctena quinquepunctata]